MASVSPLGWADDDKNTSQMGLGQWKACSPVGVYALRMCVELTKNNDKKRIFWQTNSPDTTWMTTTPNIAIARHCFCVGSLIVYEGRHIFLFAFTIFNASESEHMIQWQCLQGEFRAIGKQHFHLSSLLMCLLLNAVFTQAYANRANPFIIFFFVFLPTMVHSVIIQT